MIDLYIGSTAGGWALDGRMRGWDTHDDVPAALAHWAGEIVRVHATRWRRAPVALWLSGGLARPMLCAPVAGLRGWSEAEALAAVVAPESTGLAGPCAVRLEEWPDRAPVFATAVDASLEDAIARLPRTHGVAWLGVRPWWAAALEDALRKRPGARVVAVAEDDALTLLGGPAPGSALGNRTQPAFDYATTYAPAPDERQVTALWHRTLLAHDILADDAWFARALPGDATPAATPADRAPAVWPALAWGLEGRER